MNQQQTQDQQTQQGAVYTNEILRRLVEHYLDAESLPSKADRPLTVTLFHRLYRCVMTEGYGE